MTINVPEEHVFDAVMPLLDLLDRAKRFKQAIEAGKYVSDYRGGTDNSPENVLKATERKILWHLGSPAFIAVAEALSREVAHLL